MERFRLNILVESRIRWKVYVRFGGEHWETDYSNMVRRRVLSLHVPASTAWTAGTKNVYTVTLTGTGLIVGNVTITDWTGGKNGTAILQ